MNIYGDVVVEKRPNGLRLHCTSSAANGVQYQFEEPLTMRLTHLRTHPYNAAAGYGVTLLDRYGKDALNGKGASRSQTNNEEAAIYNAGSGSQLELTTAQTVGVQLREEDGPYTLTIDSAIGNAKRTMVELLEDPR